MSPGAGNLTAWARHCGYEPALHHRLLVDQLERVASGEVERLAVFMPPGSAKSTYGSILFPPWFMAGKHGMQVLAASHTTELAERWGRKVRGLVAEHFATLGCSLSPVSNAAGRWQLSNGSEYFAAGVGTGIAGFRADLAVIDDPQVGQVSQVGQIAVREGFICGQPLFFLNEGWPGWTEPTAARVSRISLISNTIG
jgi:hypothetical protein